MRPVSLETSISRSSVRRVRSSLRASAALSPLEASARRSSFARFALEGLQPLDGVADLVDQPLFLKQVELDRARQLRHLDAQARNVILRANVGALLRLRHPLELRGFPQTFVVQLGDLVEDLERFLGLVFDFLFGQLFVVELDDFLDRARALAEVVADRQQFLQDDRGARNRFEDEQLPALDALGDGHFALARQAAARCPFRAGTCEPGRSSFRACPA